LKSLDWLNDKLLERKQAGLLRMTAIAKHLDAVTIEIDSQSLINFGSNDYLGLATHPDILQASNCPESISLDLASNRWGSGASPLISGYGPNHAALEHEIAQFEECEAAILFSTGYAANVGTVAALAGHEDIIFSDELNHASLIDGCRLSRAKVCVYPHADIDLLRELVREHRGQSKRAFIVTDSLFSMDGDIAPLRALADLADEFDMVIVVDEAHATGVYGRSGRGLCEECDLIDRIPVRIGTLSKAIGSLGGFVAGSQHLIDYLRNFARTYIYSTAMPPAMARAACVGLRLAHSMNQQRQALRRTSVRLREALTRNGLTTSSGDSPIIPVYLCDPATTVERSIELRRRGFFVPAIRPPTVPHDRSMLRISLSTQHTESHIDGLIQNIKT
jgi:8-amino-7-oxononanoate synthase